MIKILPGNVETLRFYSLTNILVPLLILLYFGHILHQEILNYYSYKVLSFEHDHEIYEAISAGLNLNLQSKLLRQLQIARRITRMSFLGNFKSNKNLLKYLPHTLHFFHLLIHSKILIGTQHQEIDFIQENCVTHTY